MTINTQPLMTNQYLHYGSSVREWFVNLKPKLDPWDSKKLGINLKNLYNAYVNNSGLKSEACNPAYQK